MRTLDWNGFLTDPAVAAALTDLRRMATRAIKLHPLSLTSKMVNSFWYGTRGAHHIFIDDSPTASPSLVHEIIHGILMEEGYYFIRGTFHDRIHPMMTNDLQHPEVFRRMAGYGVDMAQYWSRWPTELRHALDEIKSDWHDRHASYAHFIRVYPWHFFPDTSVPFLREFEDITPTLAHAVCAAVEETRPIGFTTMDAHRRSLEILRQHWLRYCEINLPDGDCTERIVAAIRQSRIMRVSEWKDEIAEERIYENLSSLGLVREH